MRSCGPSALLEVVMVILVAAGRQFSLVELVFFLGSRSQRNRGAQVALVVMVGMFEMLLLRLLVQIKPGQIFMILAHSKSIMKISY